MSLETQARVTTWDSCLATLKHLWHEVTGHLASGLELASLPNLAQHFSPLCILNPSCQRVSSLFSLLQEAFQDCTGFSF